MHNKQLNFTDLLIYQTSFSINRDIIIYQYSYYFLSSFPTNMLGHLVNHGHAPVMHQSIMVMHTRHLYVE